VRRLAFPVLLAAAMLGSGVAPDARRTPRETPFTLLDQGGVVVDVRVNGGGPFPMLLDTGASHSVLSAEVARALDLPPVATTTVTSTLGESPRLVVRVGRLSLGPVEATSVLPSIVEQDRLGAHGAMQGLVGQDLLSAHRYTIDYRRRRIVWHEAPVQPDAADSALRLDFEHGRYLVRLPQRASVLRLVADSGAGGLVLFDGEWPARLPLTEAGRGRVAGLAGVAPARRVTLGMLRLGNLVLRDVPAVVVPLPGDAGTVGDGLLPLHLFERVTIEGPERRLWLGRGAPAAH
jgi:predicted aspartyl protease